MSNYATSTSPEINALIALLDAAWGLEGRSFFKNIVFAMQQPPPAGISLDALTAGGIATMLEPFSNIPRDDASARTVVALVESGLLAFGISPETRQGLLTYSVGYAKNLIASRLVGSPTRPALSNLALLDFQVPADFGVPTAPPPPGFIVDDQGNVVAEPGAGN